VLYDGRKFERKQIGKVEANNALGPGLREIRYDRRKKRNECDPKFYMGE
jgi:hypothetical protein